MIGNNRENLDFIEATLGRFGLVLLGVADLTAGDFVFSKYSEWLELGNAADMAFMARHQELRRTAQSLLPGARSMISVGLDYYQGDRRRQHRGPRIAQYARLKDYHQYIWRQGEAALAAIHQRLSPIAAGHERHEYRVVTDSAPLFERAAAVRSGAGFIGKNTCFIRPRGGSFLLLGELLTSLVLPVRSDSVEAPSTRTERGGCGTCKRCQVHCPTGALDRDYVLDARRCLSYWTIEHRGTIPEEFWPWFREYVFGCDICQLVCPYNRQAVLADVGHLRRLTPEPDLFELATLSQGAYEKVYGGTPLTRAKRAGLMRNGLIALAVTGDARLAKAMDQARIDGEPVVLATIAQIERWLARSKGQDLIP